MNERFDYGPGIALLRVLACGTIALTTLFLVNSYLIFWQGWPGLSPMFGESGDGTPVLSYVQFGLYAGALALVVAYVLSTRQQAIRIDARRLSAIAAYVVRGAFWSVFLIGLADMILSFLRVEELLVGVVGEELANQLSRSKERGLLVHFPLIGLSFVIAFFNRSLGFTWLAFLVVIAEFQIVISRFVYSYEQAFMGDLVRFWYASLFLFASAYALVEEGHVRVDVFYASFSERGKAWSNAIGSAVLGIPLCLVILGMGMASKGSSILSPLLSFEISQSGFGMFVKYLMAGFLIIFAYSMAVQFASYFLESVADLSDEPGKRQKKSENAH